MPESLRHNQPVCRALANRMLSDTLPPMADSGGWLKDWLRAAARTSSLFNNLSKNPPRMLQWTASTSDLDAAPHPSQTLLVCVALPRRQSVHWLWMLVKLGAFVMSSHWWQRFIPFTGKARSASWLLMGVSSPSRLNQIGLPACIERGELPLWSSSLFAGRSWTFPFSHCEYAQKLFEAVSEVWAIMFGLFSCRPLAVSASCQCGKRQATAGLVKSWLARAPPAAAGGKLSSGAQKKALLRGHDWKWARI